MKDIKDNLDSKMFNDLMKEIIRSISVVDVPIKMRSNMEPLASLVSTLPYNPDIQ